MIEPVAMDESDNSQPAQRRIDTARLAGYRMLVERLSVTMRPSLNQQLSKWEGGTQIRVLICHAQTRRRRRELFRIGERVGR